MTITRAQIKAARQLLGWSQVDLAGHVGVSAKTIAIFETGERQRPKLALQHVREVLQSASVEFIAENGGAGVRLRKG
jgi:DNA-binding XRE family transcriptional regulator